MLSIIVGVLIAFYPFCVEKNMSFVLPVKGQAVLEQGNFLKTTIRKGNKVLLKT